jgi:hypothetical protein
VSAIWLSGAQAFCPAPSGLAVAVQRGGWRHGAPRGWPQCAHDRPQCAGTGQAGPADEPFAVAARQRLEAWWRPAADGSVCFPARKARSLRSHPGPCLRRQGANLEAQMLAEGLGFQVAVRRMSIWSCQQAARTPRDRPVWGVAPVACTESGADQAWVCRGQWSCEQGSAQSRRGWIELQDRLYCALHPICWTIRRCRLKAQGRRSRLAAGCWIVRARA